MCNLLADSHPLTLNKRNSISSPKIQTQFFSKNITKEEKQQIIKQKKIEEIMDPKKQKMKDLKNFEIKLENNQENIEQLIVNTIPNEIGSKQDINAKEFFKEKVNANDGLKFETPAFKPDSKGLFDFEMNMEDLKNEDIFFSNKAKTMAESVGIWKLIKIEQKHFSAILWSLFI